MTAPSRRLFPAGAALLVVISVLGVAGQNTPPTQGLTLLSKDGRRTLATSVVGDQEVVALDDLAALFQLSVREEAGAVTVSFKGKTIVLTPDQALASVAGRLVSMSGPPVRINRRLYVPLDFVSRALAPVVDVRLDLRRASRLLIVGDLRVPRVVVRFDALPSARLTIDATPRTTSTVAQDNNRLTIRFDADAIDLGPLPQLPAQGAVQALHQIDPVTIGVELGPRFGSFHASSQPVDQAMRLVVDFVAPVETTAAPVSPPTATPASPPPELPPGIGAPPSGFRTIAIDPGHGGDDDGVKGAQGVKEKDVTLSIARRVRALVEGRLGLRVLLTRDDDRAVAIEDRASVANNNKVDLFISLHANASWRASTKGTAVYCASFDPQADAAARAATLAERLPAFGGGVREIDVVPWDLAQTRHVDQSVDFAHILEEQFKGALALGPRGADRAPLRVLEPANMPAVLVELGYLSNPDQEKQLASPDYQSSISQAIANAVIQYRDSVTAGGTR